jgi:SAM-dependent methyltransferase
MWSSRREDADVSHRGPGRWFAGRKADVAVALSHFPNRPLDAGVVNPRRRPAPETGFSLPIPPEELRFGYGKDAREYHESGVRHVAAMRSVLAKAGAPIESARRILDFGCAAGRMIRALEDLAAGRDIWGCDVMGPHVAWCREHLTPPFRFLTSSLVPHLPFEDRFLDLLYAGSVFTHFEDTAEAWMLELTRIVRPGGHLYVTIHDRRTIELLAGDRRSSSLAEKMRAVPEFETFARSDFGMFSIRTGGGRVQSMTCNVFYDVDYFKERVPPFVDVVAVEPEAYGYQTAVLLRRK